MVMASIRGDKGRIHFSYETLPGKVTPYQRRTAVCKTMADDCHIGRYHGRLSFHFLTFWLKEDKIPTLIMNCSKQIFLRFILK